MATPLTDLVLKTAGLSAAGALLVGVPITFVVMAWRHNKLKSKYEFSKWARESHASTAVDCLTELHELRKMLKFMEKALELCNAGHAPTGEYSVLPTDEVAKFRR